MNSNTETTDKNSINKPSAPSPRVQFLQDRIAEFKQRALESPERAGDLNIRIACYQKSLDDLLRADNKEQNLSENTSTSAPEGLNAGDQAATGRRTDGDDPATHRSPAADSPPPLGEPPNPIERAILDELTQRSQSPLDKLPPETQEQLFDLLSRYPVTSVLNTVTRPKPHGWGLQTSYTSLRRFRDRFAELKLREHRRELKATAKNILEDLEGADEQFATASERLLKLRLLETANNPASSVRDLRDLFQTLIRLRALEQRKTKS